MARTPSRMLALGTPAPGFALPDYHGEMVTFTGSEGRPVLVMFICNHCPFVKHIRDKLSALGNEAVKRGVKVFAINSNDVENYPEDSPELMAEEAREAGYQFPYLYDASQSVAKAYQAACTPDFYLFDAQGKLAYRGQFDESRPGNGIPVTGRDLQNAVDAVLAGRAPSSEQRPSLGCNIKWKPGQEPNYGG